MSSSNQVYTAPTVQLPPLATTLIQGVVQHLLTGIGGAGGVVGILIADGVIPAGQAAAFVTIAVSIVVWGAGLAWTQINHVNHNATAVLAVAQAKATA